MSQAGIASAVNPSSVTETLTGNSGGAVPPDGGNNINVLGDGVTIDVVGDPGTNTLTISAIGSAVTETLTGNSGGAVGPTTGNINLVGSGAVNIVGNPGTSTLTVSVNDLGLTWHTISASQALVSNNGYICTGGTNLLLSLPATSALGDTIVVTLDGSTSFSITQGSGQRIRIGQSQTTSGSGGSATSVDQGDTITIVCQTANDKWNAISMMGNLVIV